MSIYRQTKLLPKNKKGIPLPDTKNPDD